jgi:hypothetical protein
MSLNGTALEIHFNKIINLVVFDYMYFVFIIPHHWMGRRGGQRPAQAALPLG